jgi:Transcription factor Tfb4
MTFNGPDSIPQKITIDVCQLHGPDTVFLQQAAHLTGGSYIFLERRDALLQYLIVSGKKILYLILYFYGFHRCPSSPRYPFERSCPSLLKIRLTSEQLVFVIKISLTSVSFVPSAYQVCLPSLIL